MLPGGAKEPTFRGSARWQPDSAAQGGVCPDPVIVPVVLVSGWDDAGGAGGWLQRAPLFHAAGQASELLSQIDLKLLGASAGRIRILEPMELGADAKVMVALENRRADTKFDNEALYAINAEGKCFRPESAKNTWGPMDKCEPFLRLAPPSADTDL